MDIVYNNPFRVLDLPVTASEREIAKQVNLLAVYAEMGKSKEYNSDFSVLPTINRPPETIKDAFNKIEQGENKLFYSLFWFWSNDSADELALELLKEGKTEKALDIWGKAISNGSSAKKNLSNFKNLSLLNLILAVSGEEFQFDNYRYAIELAGLFFNSESIANYSQLIAGERYIYNPSNVLDFFISNATDIVLGNTNNKKITTVGKLLIPFNSFPKEAKQIIYSRFAAKQIQNIEAKIEVANTSKRNSPSTATTIGKTLIQKTKTDITFIKNVLGEDNYYYQAISEKLVFAIIQCGIDAFNSFKTPDGEINYSKAIPSEEDYLSEYEYAFTIAVTPRAKEKAKDNLDSCKQYISDKSLYNCWFCGKNSPVPASKFSKTIYRVTSREYRRVQFKYLPIDIPRCPECQKIQNKSSEIITFSVLGFIVVGLIIGIYMDGYWFAGILIGGFVGWGIGSILKERKISKVNIKDTSDSIVKEYPVLKEALKDGWQFSKPTA